MAISILEHFDESTGQLQSYDTPFGYSLTTLNQILANQHVDLRIFDNSAKVALRTQSDLDALTQTTLDTETQTQLEQVQTSPGEAWQVIGSPTGTTGSLSVGLRPERNNWHGAQITCSGSALDITLQSSMASAINGAVNIASQDYVGFICPDFTNFNTGTSTITLCSNATGDFSTNNSATLAFSANLSGTANYLKFGLGSFSAGGFDPNAVTGVKIRFVSASNPSNGTKLTVMAIRAVKAAWLPQAYDVETRDGVFTSSVSLTGGDPSSAAFVPLVRGVHNGTEDPRPMDTTLSMHFFTGALTASNSNTPFNQIELLFRENQTVSTGRYLLAQFSFRNGSTKATTLRRLNAVDDAASKINYTGLPVLNPSSFYVIQANNTNQSIVLNLYESNITGFLGRKIWSSLGTSLGVNAAYIREQGRVGWNVSLVDRDVQLHFFGASTTSFSTMRTKVFNTYSPVDGAQLQATFSSDTNLWTGFQGQDMGAESSRTLSNQSYRASLPIFTNDFLVEDWAQMYLDFDIFIPSSVTLDSQPYVTLTSSNTFTNIVLPKPVLQPNQWTHVSIDLAQAAGSPTGITYRLWVGSFTAVTTPAQLPYSWYIDNFVIGRRNVSWQFLANPGLATWRDFGQTVNDPFGALKLPLAERGTGLQLQAVALTQEAWIAGFSLIPRYASLGKPTFY